MKPVSASDLLSLWERGLNQSLIQNTLNLLALACPEMALNDIGTLSIGERDARLLQLRKWMFGPCLKNIVNCPECTKLVEWENDIENIQLQSVQNKEQKELSLRVDEYSVRFRLLNSVDLFTVIEDEEVSKDPQNLFANCILEFQCMGEEGNLNDIPEKVMEAINRRMEEEDPQADIQMEVVCPHCSHGWIAPFDIASYLWTEIHSWAKNILRDVFVLANAFGWSEKEILNMHPVRRKLYLEMVNS